MLWRMPGQVPYGLQESWCGGVRIPYLAPLAVGVALGVLVEGRLAIPLWLCVAGFGLCGGALAAALARGWWGAGVVLLVLAAGWVGAGLHHVCYRRAERNHIVLYAPSDDALVRLVGVVVSEPAQIISDPGAFARWLPKQRGVRFLLESRQILTREAALAASGLVQVRVNGRTKYWASRSPIPGGISFENFEMVAGFRSGLPFWFGVRPEAMAPSSSPEP